MSGEEFRVQFERAAALVDGLVVLPREIVIPGQVRVADERKRVQFLRLSRLIDGLIWPPDGGQEAGVELVGRGIVGVEFDGPLEIPLGALPIPVAFPLRVGQ